MEPTAPLDDEIICDRCKGLGFVSAMYCPYICPKCQGEKKLDWISAITGVPPKTFVFNNVFAKGDGKIE